MINIMNLQQLRNNLFSASLSNFLCLPFSSSISLSPPHLFSFIYLFSIPHCHSFLSMIIYPLQLSEHQIVPEIMPDCPLPLLDQFPVPSTHDTQGPAATAIWSSYLLPSSTVTHSCPLKSHSAAWWALLSQCIDHSFALKTLLTNAVQILWGLE